MFISVSHNLCRPKNQPATLCAVFEHIFEQIFEQIFERTPLSISQFKKFMGRLSAEAGMMRLGTRPVAQLLNWESKERLTVHTRLGTGWPINFLN